MNWSHLRKIEIIIFAIMFLIIPIFMWKIFQITFEYKMSLRLASIITSEILSAQSKARNLSQEIILKSVYKESTDTSELEIISSSKNYEKTIILPFDFMISGLCKIEPNGLPLKTTIFKLNYKSKFLNIYVRKSGQLEISKVQDE